MTVTQDALPPDISLIIATLHDDGDLALCLDSLVKLTPGAAFEVIVVDQNGDDRLVELIASFSDHLTIIHKRVDFQHANRARNLGAQLASGTWLGFPDDDCQFYPDTLVEISRLTANTKVEMVMGVIVDLGGKFLHPRDLKPITLTHWTVFTHTSESALYVNAIGFFEVGGFDDNFGPGARYPAAECLDLQNRMLSRLELNQAIYSPKIKLKHPIKMPPWNRWALRRSYSYACGSGAVVAKHFTIPMAYYGISRIAANLIKAAHALIRLQGWESLSRVAAAIGMMRGFNSYALAAFKK
jgi:glycosyltransferase involved in cell wall biosynthesis